MPHKIIKATLPIAALGALSQVAQADMLDDAIKDAKDAGFSTSVQTRTEKVSSQSEATRLNQEETLRVQALAKRIQNQVQSAKSSDQSVQTVVTSVLTNQEKESTSGLGPNQTITKENADSQKAYENAVKSVEAKNAQAQATYEAEKARIAQENAKALADYEAEKARVATQNAENQKTYTDTLKRIASENQQAKNAYELAKQKAEAELHTKEWLDAKVIEDAKAAGVTVRPAKTVDKGTVKESDLAGLQGEYDKASAEVRAKLEIAKKEVAKANVEFKASNELKQFVKTQQDAIKAIIDKDNANTATTHIRTVIKQGPVIENTDELKKAYQDLLQTAKDNAVRRWGEQQDYYKEQGKSEEERIALALKAMAQQFLSDTYGYFDETKNLTNKFLRSLGTLGVKVTEVPITQTLPVLPIDADATSDDPKVVAYKQAIKELTEKVNKVYTSNEIVNIRTREFDFDVTQGYKPGVYFSDNYEADLKKYNEEEAKRQTELQNLRNEYDGAPMTELVNAYNYTVTRRAPALMTEIYSRAAHGGEFNNRFTNESKIDITKSSDSVQYLNPPTTFEGGMFDIRAPKSTATSPQFFSFVKPGVANATAVDVALVRIPKGQSITVKYSLKSGQPYMSGKQMLDGTPLSVQLFAKATADQYKASDKELTDADIQDVYTIEATITNDGGVQDGDLIVGVANRTGAPFILGVSNGHDVDDRTPWKLNAADPRLAFSYHTETVLRNQDGQILTPGLIQGKLVKEPHYTPDHTQIGTTFRLNSNDHYTTNFNASLEDGRELTLVDHKPNEIGSETISWHSYTPIYNDDGEYIVDPPTGWEDNNMWSLMRQGMTKDNTSLTATRKTYNKRLLDWGTRDDQHNWSTIYETGDFYVTSGSRTTPTFSAFNLVIPPRPIQKPKEVRIPKVTVELVREVALPRPKSTDPVDPVTVASIEPVKWMAKYTKPYTEKPPVPKENPVKPPILPEPKKPEEKPLPTPPKKEELPKQPELKAIASGSNSFVVRSHKAVRPSITVERIQYVAEGRVSSANSLVVRTRNDVKRAGSGNSFIIRRLG